MSDEALTPGAIDEVVWQAAERLALDATGHRLLKFTNNAVVGLPAAGVVLRIAGSRSVRGRVPGVISAAHWFGDHKIPAVRLQPGVDRALQIGPHLVTVWQEILSTAVDPAPADLAAILRAIHSVNDDDSSGLPPWNVAGSMRSRIDHAAALPADAANFLRTEADSIIASLNDLRDIPPLMPPGVIHGDAHLGNVLIGPEGPVICDFDSTSVGPREWDLTPAAVGSLRFRYPQDVHAGLVASYGVDVTGWEGFPILRRLREFQLVASVVPVLEANVALVSQWRHRYETYRDRDNSAIWTPYADAQA